MSSSDWGVAGKRGRWAATASACALLLAASPAAAGALYVYEGNGSDGRKALPAFEHLIGRKVDGVVDFIAFDSWTSFDNDAAWGIAGWRGSGYRLAESVPLTVKGTSLAEVASGAQDAHYRRLAKLLVDNGFGDAYLRLGWEFNGGWYPWAFKGHEQDFSQAFAHVAHLMKATPGSRFRIVWNPSIYMQQQWPDWVWPGDEAVDLVALDVYNQSWAVGALSGPNQGAGSALWDHVANDAWGAQAFLAWRAKKHPDKPYAFPEWGTGDRPDGHGGGDDAAFIDHMAPLVRGAAFAGYWDYNAGDYNSKISSGQRPATGRAFVAAFGSSSSAASSP